MSIITRVEQTCRAVRLYTPCKIERQNSMDLTFCLETLNINCVSLLTTLSCSALPDMDYAFKDYILLLS